MGGNEQLNDLMTQAGFIREDGSVGLKVFARAVSQFGPRTYTHTYVRRWLEGRTPRDAHTLHAIAAALGERLGRTVALDELGFGLVDALPADFGLHYPATPVDSITALTRLWRADLEQVQALLAASANVGAWNEVALSWVVASTYGGVTSSKSGQKVGAADIARIRRTTELFERLDAQYGGDHARSALIKFLHKDLGILLNGSYDDETGRELFQAAAQSTMLAAWMSYDSGLHGLAQRYFVQALGLAEVSGDRLLAGGILDAMSHQATFLGRYRESANLARAARLGTEALHQATLTAHFFIMEARALARRGDTYACDRAMSAAVREFERRRPQDDPDWFQYFDDSEFAAELAHCNRDLGRPLDATTYATQAVGANGDQVRSEFFATMVLAEAYFDQGDSEEACQVALAALKMGEQVNSTRCALYVDEFRERIQCLGNSPTVRKFGEQASAYRLWTPSTRTAPNSAGSHHS